MSSFDICWAAFEIQPPKPEKRCNKHPDAPYVSSTVTRASKSINDGRTEFTCSQCERRLGYAKITPLGQQMLSEITELKKENKKQVGEANGIDDLQQRKSATKALREILNSSMSACINKYGKRQREIETPGEDEPPMKRIKLMAPIQGNKTNEQKPPLREGDVEMDDVSKQPSSAKKKRKREKKEKKEKKKPKKVKRNSSAASDDAKEAEAPPKKRQKNRTNWFLQLDGIPENVEWEMFEIFNVHSRCSVGDDCTLKGRRHFHCKDTACLVEGATPALPPASVNTTPGGPDDEKLEPGADRGANVDVNYVHRWVGRTGKDIRDHLTYHGDTICFEKGKQASKIERNLSDLRNAVQEKQIEITKSYQDASNPVTMSQLAEWNRAAKAMKQSVGMMNDDECKWVALAKKELNDHVEATNQAIHMLTEMQSTHEVRMIGLKSEAETIRHSIEEQERTLLELQTLLDRNKETQANLLRDIESEDKMSLVRQGELEKHRAIIQSAHDVVTRLDRVENHLADVKTSKAIEAVNKRVRRLITAKEGEHRSWSVNDFCEWLEYLNADYGKYKAKIKTALSDDDSRDWANGVLGEINFSLLKTLGIKDKLDCDRILDNVKRIQNGPEGGQEANNISQETDCWVCFGSDGTFLCVPCGCVCVCGNPGCHEVAKISCPRCQTPTQMLIKPKT